jgi:hypothetical protein
MLTQAEILERLQKIRDDLRDDLLPWDYIDRLMLTPGQRCPALPVADPLMICPACGQEYPTPVARWIDPRTMELRLTVLVGDVLKTKPNLDYEPPTEPDHRC